MSSTIEAEQILYRAVTDKEFGKYTLAKIPSNDATLSEDMTIIEAINRYYRSYDKPISSEALKLGAKKILNARHKLTDEVELKLTDRISSIYALGKQGNANYSTDDSIRSGIDNWSRKTVALGAIKRILASGADFGKEATLEKLQKAIKESLVLGSSVDKFEISDIFRDDVSKTADEISKINEDTISTGWNELDRVMGGGLAKGEMGLVVAQSGYGKTQTLVNLTKQYALYARKNVMYVALEEKSARMLMRLVQLLGQVGKKSLMDDIGKLDKKATSRLLTALQKAYQAGSLGDITLYKSRPHFIGVADIERAIQNYGTLRGYYPDVLIIDYPDLMKNDNYGKINDEYKADGILYEQLRSLGEQYNSLVWVASQTNRTANITDLVTAYSIEGSKQKLNPVELCMSLNRNEKEYQNGFIRFYLDKVRNGDKLPKDRLIGLKVNQKYIGYENETAQDEQVHSEIVKAGDDDHFSEYRKKENKISSKDVVKKINETNKRLLEG